MNCFYLNTFYFVLMFLYSFIFLFDYQFLFSFSSLLLWLYLLLLFFHCRCHYYFFIFNAFNCYLSSFCNSILSLYISNIFKLKKNDVAEHCSKLAIKKHRDSISVFDAKFEHCLLNLFFRRSCFEARLLYFVPWQLLLLFCKYF